MKKPSGKPPSRDVTTVVKSGNPDYLRHARLQAGLSLRDLSAEAGVSPTYVMYLEKGTKPLSLERLETFESAIKRLRAARSGK
jgi:transcriptional regulator with XRE-family HTH domain